MALMNMALMNMVLCFLPHKDDLTNMGLTNMVLMNMVLCFFDIQFFKDKKKPCKMQGYRLTNLMGRSIGSRSCN